MRGGSVGGDVGDDTDAGLKPSKWEGKPLKSESRTWQWGEINPQGGRWKTVGVVQNDEDGT
jgi:hypothetical protein